MKEKEAKKKKEKKKQRQEIDKNTIKSYGRDI